MKGTAIHIGASKEGVEATKKAIMDILKSEQDQATIQVALNAFATVTQVNNASVSNCTITCK